ncbi:hypothetical protein [Sorangium sp. So ce1151]|uniref:hypothetical protein n=1 Tax=Sorangium sp. So ce1151 TaxID=3133332 RepID=UPI003F616703
MAAAKSDARDAAPVARAAEESAPGSGAGAPSAQEPPAAPVEPTASSQHRSWVPVIPLGAASVVGLGVGLGTTFASNAASNEAHRQSAAIIEGRGQCVMPESSWAGPCEQVRNDASRADTLGNVARVAFIASGAFAIAAATYVLWPKPKRSAYATALPVVHPEGAGFAVKGAW